MIGIYKISNLINGNSYIGQSNNIKLRWNKHRSVAFQPNSKSYYYPLYLAIRKYGLKNFEFSILEECSKEMLNIRELFWGKQYDVYKNGYNQTSGIDVGSHGISLTIQKVEEIQNLLLNTTITQLDLADRYGVSKDTICSINVGRSWINELLQYPIRIDYIAKRKVERPTREELKQLIRTETFVAIGKKYKLTDSAIKKWCDSNNLPRTKREINKYSDSEWKKI